MIFVQEKNNQKPLWVSTRYSIFNQFTETNKDQIAKLDVNVQELLNNQQYLLTRRLYKYIPNSMKVELQKNINQ